MTESELGASYDADTGPVATYARKVKPNKAFYDRVIATKTNDTRTLAYEEALQPHTRRTPCWRRSI